LRTLGEDVEKRMHACVLYVRMDRDHQREGDARQSLEQEAEGLDPRCMSPEAREFLLCSCSGSVRPA
jgi:hypothetical protein